MAVLAVPKGVNVSGVPCINAFHEIMRWFLGLSVDETLSSLVSPNSTRRLRAAPGGVEAAVGGVPWGDSSVVVSGQGTVLPKIQILYTTNLL